MKLHISVGRCKQYNKTLILNLGGSYLAFFAFHIYCMTLSGLSISSGLPLRREIPVFGQILTSRTKGWCKWADYIMSFLVTDMGLFEYLS